MGYNVDVSLPESLKDLAARNVGFTVENVRGKNCELVMDGKVRFEACITDEEDCWIYAIVMRSSTGSYQDELEKRLRDIYGEDEINWYEAPNQ